MLRPSYNDVTMLVNREAWNGSASSPSTDIDNEGHYTLSANAALERTAVFPSGRYTTIKLLGAGVYGRVVMCRDNQHNKDVAVKIVRRGILAYEISARKEISILRDLKSHPQIPTLLRTFADSGHICLCFNILGEDLKTVMARQGPFSVSESAEIMRQLISGLQFVHQKRIIHTDIKTDNILLRANGAAGQAPGNVTLIDFGSAIYDSDYHPPGLGTQQYNSPEALLQTGWSFPTDIWSAGCVLAELLEGQTLFPRCKLEDHHLAAMQRVLGTKLPPSLLNAAGCYPNPNKPIRFLTLSIYGSLQFNPPQLDCCTADSHSELLKKRIKSPEALNLLQKMLELEPWKRPTASQLMQDPFLTNVAARSVCPSTSPRSSGEQVANCEPKAIVTKRTANAQNLVIHQNSATQAFPASMQVPSSNIYKPETVHWSNTQQLWQNSCYGGLAHLTLSTAPAFPLTLYSQ